MFKKFNALEELYVQSQGKEELICTDLLGKTEKYQFEWQPPISQEKLNELILNNNLKLPEEYINFLLMSDGAILYNNEENAGYQLLSLEDAVNFTNEMRKSGYDDIKKEWLIFMTNLFDSDWLLIDMDKINNRIYIIDGVVEYRADHWKYLKGDFRIFMNQLFRVNGIQYWRW